MTHEANTEVTQSNDISKTISPQQFLMIAVGCLVLALCIGILSHLMKNYRTIQKGVIAHDETLNLPPNKITMQYKNQSFNQTMTHEHIDPSIGRLSLPSVITLNKDKTTTSANESSSNNVFVDNDSNADFMNKASAQEVQVSISHIHHNLDYTIFQGKMFTAVLSNAIDSDLPGTVVSVISQPIYGFHGKIELLPKGTRLVGLTNSNIAFGSKRVFIAWQRAIRPDGIDIMIGSPGADSLGQAGLGGTVDTHFWERFRDSALMTLLGAGASYSSEGNNSNLYQQAVVSSAMQSSNQALRGNAQMQPTIHIPQGTIINVMVTRDLIFSSSLLSQVQS